MPNEEDKPEVVFRDGMTLHEEIAALWIAAGKANWNVPRTLRFVNEALDGNYSAFLIDVRKHFTIKFEN